MELFPFQLHTAKFLESIQNTPIQGDVPGEPLFGKFIVAKSSEFALN